MKKKLFKILIFIILLLPCYVYAEDISYDNAQKIVKEVMQAWYMRGTYRHYNHAKMNSYTEMTHPEESTSQDMGYTVCSGFTSDVYKESFGVSVEDKDTYSKTNIPKGSTQYCLHTKSYITNDEHKCVTGESKSGCNGEYAIYYEEKNDNNKTYFYKKQNQTFDNDNRPTVAEFAQNIKPGDLFAYDGHILIAYEVTNDDVLLLESNGGGTAGLIKTKIDPEYATKRLYYRNVQSPNDIIDLTVTGSQMTLEGTTNNKQWLSQNTKFVENGRIKCSREYCSVSRFFYEDSNHNAVFNYTVQEQQIKNSMVRLSLPGIFIHKTADALDNNSVYPDQEITYTIKIANQSNVNKKDGGKNYSKFYVSEVIPTDDVEFVSATNDGQYNNGKLTWTINSLNYGQNITLTYKVKVKNNVVGKKIKAEGTVYVDNTGSITTGVVSNEVIRKPATKKDTYQNCYNKYKDSKKELDLINEVYKCSYDVDLKLNKFSLDGEDNNMFSKLMYKSSNSKITIVNNDVTKNYYDMILNDYMNSLTVPETILESNEEKSLYYLPSWSSATRADTIYDNHFKDGDILIYYNDDTNTKEELRFTKEQGIYAYIYLDGKFVGQNQIGDAARNEFTYQYYTERSDIGKNNLMDTDLTNDELTFVNYQTLFGKDYYVILRPEKIIESSSTEINEDSTTVEVPNTGKKESLYLILIGSLMVISGSVVLISKRKRVN